jgi:hypothetical protein
MEKTKHMVLSSPTCRTKWLFTDCK